MNRTKQKLTKLLMLAILVVSIMIPLSVTTYCASGDTTVYITATGKCYHTDSCSSAKKVTPTTLENAVAVGLKACSKCNPPTLDDAGAVVTSAKSSEKVAVATGNQVWVTKSGKKYHSTNNCGNTDSAKAKLMDEADAIAKGLGKCSKCW